MLLVFIFMEMSGMPHVAGIGVDEEDRDAEMPHTADIGIFGDTH